MAQAASSADDDLLIIFQLGTNNWQVRGEPTSGSGILHEAHHATYNRLPNTVCYSIWPSNDGLQTTESFVENYKSAEAKQRVRVYPVSGKIPVCESNHPLSARRWHSMTPAERGKFYNETAKMVRDYLYDIENKYHPGKKIGLIIAHHTFLNPIILNRVLAERKSKGLSVPPVGVFIHGTGIKMYQHELREVREISEGKLEEKQREFLLKDAPLFGSGQEMDLKNDYKSFLNWVDQQGMKLFDCDSDLKPAIGYAISHKSLNLFSKTFGKFPKERLVLSPNGIDTSVVFKRDLTIAEAIKDLKTFPAFKDEASISVPLKAPSGKDWSHMIVHVSKMADWKRPDSVLIGFSMLVKEYPDALCIMVGQGTPEMNERFQGLNRELGLTKNCFFVGQKMLNELPIYYSAADVGVFPSKEEPFGMVFIECMVCGTPIIGANSGGPKDFMIRDEKRPGLCTTGVLVEEDKDNQKVGQSIGKYLIQAVKEDWKKNMADACTGFKERFTVKTQCENILIETRKILGRL